MILSDQHFMADLRELWTFKSFRARIFMTIVPTLAALMFANAAFDKQKPYIFHEDGSFIAPAQGHGGDQVTVNWRVTFNRQCPGIVERQLIDPVTEVIIAQYDPAPAAINGVTLDGEFLRKTFQLPRNVQHGWIGYQSKLTYTCNWLQRAWPNTFGIRYLTPRLKFLVQD